MKKVFPFFFALVFLLSSCGSENIVPVSKAPEFFTLKREMFSENLELTGTLEALKETPVAAKMGGRIAELHAEVGDTVKNGSLLGVLAGDETAVGAETSRMNEVNMQNTITAQKQLLDAQVKNAEQALILAKTQVKTLETAKSDTSLSTEEQMKLAQTAVAQAETQLENTKNLANQRLATLYKNAKSAIRSALIVVTNASNFSDGILGVSKEKEHLNDAYEMNLGSMSSSSKTTAQNTFRKVLTKKDAFKSLYDEKIEGKESSYEEYDKYLEIALDSLESTQSLLEELYTMLDASTSGSALSETQLESWKQQTMTLGQNTESAILSVSGGVKLGVKGVILSRDEIFTQNQAEIASAEKALAQSNQALAQMKAGTSQNKSSVQSQKTLAEQQVKQAESALASAKAQRDSVLKELNQQLGLVQGNTKLSQVSLANTQLFAPFSGVVTEKFAEVGQVIGAGQPVFSVADMSGFLIKTDIPDTALKNVREGVEAEVQLDGVSGTVKAKVTKVYPKVDPQTRKLGIELTLNEKPQDARIGMFSRITMKFPEKEAYFVPKSFVFASDFGSFVLLKNGEKKKVFTGVERGNAVKIWFEGEMEGIVITNE